MGIPTANNPVLGSTPDPQAQSPRKQDVQFLTELIKPIVDGDAESVSATLVEKYGSAKALLTQVAGAAVAPPGLGPQLFDYLKTIAGFFSHMLEQEILTAPVVSSSRALRDYVFNAGAGLEHEQFRVLYLNSSKRLINDQVMSEGTVDKVQVYPRDIVKTALDMKASAIILVHNHPSGDPAPSKGDVELTRELIAACRMFDLELIEHLIVARGGVIGMRDMGFLPDGMT